MKKDLCDDVCFFLCFGYDDDDDDDDAFGYDDARFSARCALKSLSSFLCSTALTC